jgi:hypothetical protein
MDSDPIHAKDRPRPTAAPDIMAPDIMAPGIGATGAAPASGAAPSALGVADPAPGKAKKDKSSKRTADANSAAPGFATQF